MTFEEVLDQASAFRTTLGERFCSSSARYHAVSGYRSPHCV